MMRQCFLCKKDDLEYYDEGKQVMSCRNCGALFSESRTQNYPSILDSNKNSSNKTKLIIQKLLSKIIAEQYLEYLVSKTGLKFTSALDVGAGFGYFVRGLQNRGIDAYGVESDDVLLRHRVTDKIQHGVFNESFTADKKFDLISVNQALYYFPDVISILKKIHDMLTDGGFVLVVTVNPQSSFRHKFRIWTQGSCVCLSRQNFSSMADLGLQLVDCTAYDDNLYVDVSLHKRGRLSSARYFLRLLAYLLKLKPIQYPDNDGVHNFVLLKKISGT